MAAKSADSVRADDGASCPQAPVTDLKALRCPYCGDEFSADLRYTLNAHSEHRDLHGYECDNFACNARWDKFGNPTRAPGSAS